MSLPEASLVSVDVVAVRFAATDATPRVAIIRRDREPYAGELALPGVLLGRGERLYDAALRAITGKVGLEPRHIRAVGQLATFDEPLRDPRGPTLSLSMWAVIDPAAPADTASWFAFGQIPHLAFDHGPILEVARAALAGLLWRDRNFTRAILGEEFSTARALALAEALGGTRPDRGNLNRMLRSMPGLKQAEAAVRSGGPGRPYQPWVWT